jgi:TRAP-type C4-dicarboxylate transport system permease small subunit
VEEWLVGAFIATVATLVFLSAIARTAGSPINWATDLSLLLFAWLTFLGADVALKHADFIRVDILLNRFPTTVRKGLYYLFNIAAIGLLATIVVQGIPLAIDNSARLFQTLGISYAWATLSAPVGCFLMIVTLTLRMIERRKDKEIIIEGKEAF